MQRSKPTVRLVIGTTPSPADSTMASAVIRGGPVLGLFRLGRGLPSSPDLTPEESARWRRMSAPLRAAQYLAGRWLLRRLCAESTGLAMDAVHLNAEGAPSALGPEGVEFPRLSLAHSGDWVAAVACFGPCGVDLERRGAGRDWQGLAKHLGIPQAGGEEAVLKAWTLKEARFKAAGGAGLAVWRFETPDYLGCLLAPSGAAPDVRYFGGEGDPSAVFQFTQVID